MLGNSAPQAAFLTISTGARSAPAKILTTISTCYQFQLFGKCGFAAISTDQQFLLLSSREETTISTENNFNIGFGESASLNVHNFNDPAISTA